MLNSNNKTNQSERLKLLHALHKHFNLHIQLKIGQFRKSHLLKQSRHDIARLKFFENKKCI
nr:50S ribosomal protein L29 [Candidatus Blochmannia vafer]